MKARAPDTPAELKRRALGLLARREHSRAELARKLATHAASPEALSELLEALAAKRQLSDERYAEARAHRLARKFGAARIRHDLRSKGIAQETATRAVASAGESELERARAILARKYRGAAQTFGERARRMRFLQGRGFSADVIRALLSSRGPD